MSDLINHKLSNNQSYYIYGKHPCLSALNNKNRHCLELLITQSTYKELANQIPKHIKTSIVDKRIIESKLPKDCVHQGITLKLLPLPDLTLNDINLEKPIVMLDQVTDPHNIGAIIRSCAAFSIKTLIITKRNSPQEEAIIAKTACGALEHIDLIKVTNLERTIAELKDYGYWCYGLDGQAKDTVRDTKFDNKTLLIFGSEGIGLRNLTIKRCDNIIKLPISGNVESLNVSNAVAITLYDLSLKLGI